MDKKGYIRKTCAYCGRLGISSTGDHVLAREFFLKKDQKHHPIVPACVTCNGAKSKLETYALALLPFGSRHYNALSYAEQNIERRLARNHALRRVLVRERNFGWEPHPNGLLVPTMTLPIDTDKIYELFSFVVRGLYMHHWKIALDPVWRVNVQMLDPRREREVIGNVMQKIIGQTVAGDIGCGTFVYQAVQSATVTQLSLWQFSVFGGLEFGGVPNRPGLRLSRLFAVTRPN